MILFAPRMAPSVVRRPRLEGWFTRFRRVPVRCLVAPAGCGKTTAILSYLRSSETTGIYCALEDGATPAELCLSIAKALSLEEGSFSIADIARALAERAPLELALDRVDTIDPQARELVRELIECLPESVSMMIALRSRAAFDVGDLVARGLAALCDFERLAFDAAEIRHLAEACEITFSHTDIVKLLDASDGWPMVVSGAIRKAAEDGRTLDEAFENWRSRHQHLFFEYVAGALEDAPEQAAALAQRLMASGAAPEQSDLRALEAHGLFVVHDCEGYRPLRAVMHMRSYRQRTKESLDTMPMQVQMFGRFQATIDGKPVEWIRRRDQQIFKYVALKRNGKVSRAELAETFWPGSDRHLVAQSLRTAFCNIRKAIATIVGFDAVDAYFHVNGDVSIDLNNVIIDVNRFAQHADDGDREYERHELGAAQSRYRTADQLYSDRLLASEVQEPWFAPFAEMLETRSLLILERLAEIALELSEPAAARQLARRALAYRPDNVAMLALVTAIDRAAYLEIAELAGGATPRKALEIPASA